jgi:hypothetical protein
MLDYDPKYKINIQIHNYMSKWLNQLINGGEKTKVRSNWHRYFTLKGGRAEHWTLISCTERLSKF